MLHYYNFCYISRWTPLKVNYIAFKVVSMAILHGAGCKWQQNETDLFSNFKTVKSWKKTSENYTRLTNVHQLWSLVAVQESLLDFKLVFYFVHLWKIFFTSAEKQTTQLNFIWENGGKHREWDVLLCFNPVSDLAW